MSVEYFSWEYALPLRLGPRSGMDRLLGVHQATGLIPVAEQKVGNELRHLMT